MAATLNVTTYEHAISLFEKNFETHPFWTLYAGKMTNAAARIASWETVGERSESKEHLELINFTMGGYGDGYYVLMTRKKPNDTASQQPYYFKKGDVGDMGNMFDFGKIGSMSGNNPFQMMMVQAMIKGLSGGSDAAVVGVQKEMELLRLQFEHQKELDRLQNGVAPRIMGLIENNFEAILGKLPSLELPKVKSSIPAPAPAVKQGSSTQETTTTANAGRVMHELPLTYQPEKVSSDAMTHYAKEFQKHFPDVNPSILFAKMVAFSAAQPDMARGLFSQLEASVGEPESDE